MHAALAKHGKQAMCQTARRLLQVEHSVHALHLGILLTATVQAAATWQSNKQVKCKATSIYCKAMHREQPPAMGHAAQAR
jgi:hypothetical protein